MDRSVVSHVANAAVAIAVVLVVVGQCRRPRWLLGRFVVAIMNRSHAALAAWGLGYAEIATNATILDVGCGGGQTIRTLAAGSPDRTVHGVDYSAASVAATRRLNADLIAAGRVDVQQASVSSLPFPDATFDVVTAVETHYYWPELVHDLEEIRRVLKPNGALVLIAEVYKTRRSAVLLFVPMKLLRARYLTIEEHRAAFSAAGFSGIEVHSDPAKGWVCASGRRPGTVNAQSSLA